MEQEDRRKFTPSPYKQAVSDLSMRILGLWKDRPESSLIHRQIVDELASQGVPRHRTVRGIKRLVQERKLEKVQQGRSAKYRPIYKLKDFGTLDYLSELHMRVSRNGLVYDWGVGTGFSHAAAGTIVGYPPVEREELSPDERLALDTILVRMSELYSALMDLRDVLIIRKAGGEAKFSDDLVRQVLFECHVRSLDKTMGTTKSVYEKLSPSLGVWSDPINYMRDHNGLGSDDPARLDAIPLSLGLLNTFQKLLTMKKELKREGMDIDHYSLTELASKLRQIHEKMERHSDTTFRSLRRRQPHGIIEVAIPERTREHLSLLRRAYSVKIAEVFSRHGLREMQDMALVITRHPNTMETQMTTERMLSEFIEGMKEFGRDRIKGLSEEKLAKFLGQEFGETYYRVPPDEVDELRDKPWLKQEIGDHVGAFLKEYHSARLQRLEFERKEDLAFEDSLRELERRQSAKNETDGPAS